MSQLDLHTGAPLWPIRAGLPATYPPITSDIETDVLVVGAGISGALAAYELTKAGARVVVIDRRDVASGSTAASTGLLLYETDTTLEDLSKAVGLGNAVRVYRLGLDAIDALEAVAGGSCGFARRPSIYLASRRRDVDQLRREFELRQAHGFDVEWLDRRAIRREYSFDGPAAIRAQGTAEVDPYRLTHRLLALAEARGARIFDRTTVALPTRRGHQLIAMTDRTHSITATRVVWATGYEAHDVGGPRVGQLASTWVVATEPLAEFVGWEDRCLLWETARPYLYLRSTDDGRLVVGGEDEPCSECHRNLPWSHRKARRLMKRVSRMFPRLDLEPAYTWAGTFSTTGDGLPFIGERSEPGVWFSLGYGGNGITFSAIAAVLLRDAYQDVANPDAELFAFTRAVRTL